MQYTFSCPMEGCNYSTAVEAEDDKEATNKLFILAKEHGQNAHPDMEMTDQQIEEIVEKNTQKS